MLSIDEIENRLKNIPMKEKKLLMNLKPLQLKVQKPKLFSCELCGKSFTSNYNRKTHVKTVHENIKEFKCELCGKLFGYMSHAKSHSKMCKM